MSRTMQVRGPHRPSRHLTKSVEPTWLGSSGRSQSETVALTGSADRNAFHPQCRLANADRNALAVLAAGSNARVELEVIADHAHPVEVGGSVSDQHGALEWGPALAVFNPVG